MIEIRRVIFSVALLLAGACANAEIRTTDDNGQTLILQNPARRIISLAPNITELLFAAGAGDRIVGAVEYSNFPPAARRIPLVGNHLQLDLERIVSLQPDLVVVWLNGNAQRQLEKLMSLGIPIFYSEPRRLADIGDSISRFGQLAGTDSTAGPAARAFANRLAAMRARYSGRAPVPVFYQIWEKPLMTVNGQHLISDVIALCGGRNVFAELKSLAPVISTEAVLQANPEVIATAFVESNMADGLAGWKRWPHLKAVERGNFALVHTDLMSRHTPRILDGAESLCSQIEAARRKREKR